MTATAAFVRDLPKIHLHCHLEGTLRAQTFLELCERDGLSTRYRPSGGGTFDGVDASGDGPRDPETVFQFRDFQEFLYTFAAVSRALRRPCDYARLAREFAQDALAQNVAYAEVFISPSVWTFFQRDLDARATIGTINDALTDVLAPHGVQARLIVDLTRNFGAERAMETARLAAACLDRGVIGVGLGGDEQRFAPELFSDAFAFARANGLRTVAHAGEAAGAASVRGAIEHLRAERIGHGIRALEDPHVVALAAEREIAFEVCPTSNYLTGVASADEPHPLVALDRAGVRVTIDADDPSLFGTSIAQEYAHVATLVGAGGLKRFVENAVDASFADDAVKARLRARLASAATELAADRRR